MRTRRTRPPGHMRIISARWASYAPRAASCARANATKNASPCVSTSNPWCRPNASRSRHRCASSSAPYRSPHSFSSLVEPSTSVNRKVTVPLGGELTRQSMGMNRPAPTPCAFTWLAVPRLDQSEISAHQDKTEGEQGRQRNVRPERDSRALLTQLRLRAAAHERLGLAHQRPFVFADQPAAARVRHALRRLGRLRIRAIPRIRPIALQEDLL